MKFLIISGDDCKSFFDASSIDEFLTYFPDYIDRDVLRKAFRANYYRHVNPMSPDENFTLYKVLVISGDYYLLDNSESPELLCGFVCCDGSLDSDFGPVEAISKRLLFEVNQFFGSELDIPVDCTNREGGQGKRLEPHYF